jgi:hypothetical protein
MDYANSKQLHAEEEVKGGPLRGQKGRQEQEGLWRTQEPEVGAGVVKCAKMPDKKTEKENGYRTGDGAGNT